MYKKRKQKKWIYICLGIFVVFTILIVNIMLPNRQLSGFEKAIRDGVLGITRVINVPINYVKKVFIKEVNCDNSLFDAENAELKKDIQEMKSLLELKQALTDKRTINATTIVRNVDYWYDTIIIDKGSNDGVQVNDAVITNNGLIGYVENVSFFNSTIKLLTSEVLINKISVKIEVNGKYVFGLLVSYDPKKDVFKIEGISEYVDIPVGSVVTTTGMGSNIPSGILVGKVSEVTSDNFDLAPILLVKSAVDFNDINYITILKKGEV